MTHLDDHSDEPAQDLESDGSANYRLPVTLRNPLHVRAVTIDHLIDAAGEPKNPLLFRCGMGWQYTIQIIGLPVFRTDGHGYPDWKIRVRVQDGGFEDDASLSDLGIVPYANKDGRFFWHATNYCLLRLDG